VEIAVGAFFNGHKFILPININFEHKRLFPGEIGPATGEMGTSMFWSKPNRLFNLTLKKMETKLTREGYVGYIDLNCIVNGRGIFPLEFTVRFGYPCISIQSEGIKMPIGEFLYNLASGQDFSFKTRKGWQVGARVVVPPWPYRQKNVFDRYSKGAKVIFKKPDLSGIHIEDVKAVNGQWVLTGSAGVALIVVGTGATVEQARHQLYRRIDNIFIPNMFYRNDIGNRWKQDKVKLEHWGYLKTEK
jgi:phosphoribosylamine--glycine ligase